MTLSNLVPNEKPSSQENEVIRNGRLVLWRQILMVGLAAVEVGVWAGVWARELLEAIGGQKAAVDVVLSGLMICVWVSLTSF